MTDLSLVEALRPVQWPTLVLVIARVAGLMLIAPLWSMTGIPTTVRGGLAVAIAVALLPGVRPAVLPPDYPGLPVPVAGELFLGMAVGLTAALFVHAVALAGEVMGLQMGLNMGQALSPMMPGTAPGVGEVQSFLVLVLFTALNGHLLVLGGLAGSFQALPPGTAFDLRGGGLHLVTLAGGVFGTAARVAAPMLGAMLLTNVSLALLNRAVPQLNAMTVALPITIGLGLVVIGASLPFAAALVGGWVEGLPGATRGTIEALAPAGGR